MTKIDKYIVRQYITTFSFILGMVLAICLLVDFVEKLDEFIEKKPPMKEVIFEYYLNFLPFWGNLLTPICIFLAVIFFTSRMAGRTELIPMLSAGISFYRIMAPYLITSFLLAGVSFYLKAYLVPRSTATRIEFEYKYLKKRKISSNKNIHKKVAQDTFIYISYYNERKMEGLTFALERFKDGDITTKIQARRIYWVDSTQSWILREARVRDIDGGKESLRFYSEIDTTFLLTPDDIFIKEQKAESMPLGDLSHYIQLEEMRGSDILEELYIEKNRRFSDPIAVIILTLIGFAMSSRKSRGGIALQIGLGLLICFVYVALLFAGQAFVGNDFPPWLAVWMPNFVFLPVSVFLLRIAPK
ncbi:MAG: LptF/LptG family permease [Bacteroidia bacterium]|nr:LptF/LptG family permease [Bacteroidia bacterium]